MPAETIGLEDSNVFVTDYESQPSWFIWNVADWVHTIKCILEHTSFFITFLYRKLHMALLSRGFICVSAGGPNKTIQLEFKSMSTECSFDFLFVYDGDSHTSPMLASLSGDSHPSPVVATSGYVSSRTDNRFSKKPFFVQKFISVNTIYVRII